MPLVFKIIRPLYTKMSVVQHMFCKSNLPSMSILLISINLSYISDDWYIDGNMNKASLHNKHDV